MMVICWVFEENIAEQASLVIHDALAPWRLRAWARRGDVRCLELLSRREVSTGEAGDVRAGPLVVPHRVRAVSGSPFFVGKNQREMVDFT